MKQKPKAQVVDQGQTVTFECTIEAAPKPEVRQMDIFLSSLKEKRMLCLKLKI